MRHFKHQILSLTIILYSCGQVNQNRNIERISIDKVHTDTLFISFDTLENKWNSRPVNFDTLYRLAKQLNVQADNYPNRKEIKLTDIYKRCADIYRTQQFPDCDKFETSNNPSRSELLCSKDTSLIIDCYKKAIEIFQSNLDSLSGSSADAIIRSSSFADVMFQLADVYEQLGKFQLALPYRQEYLALLLKTEKPNLEMVGDAYMFLGSNYELQKDYKTAYKFYLQELENHRADNYRDLKNVEIRIMKFKKEHSLE
jgi:tetratricopeptide (TPR) repeat protein